MGLTRAFNFAGTLELQSNMLTGTVPVSLAGLGRLSKFNGILSFAFKF